MLALGGCVPGLPNPTEAQSSSEPPAAPEIRWVRQSDGNTRVRVEVVGADPISLPFLLLPAMKSKPWDPVFIVSIDDGSKEPTPILGRYRIERGRLFFEPRFPLVRGLHYRARFDPIQLHDTAYSIAKTYRLADWKWIRSAPVASEFAIPAPPPESPAAVVRVDPSDDVLPENLLRFYVHFSAPMSRGEVYDRVHLLDASGKRVDHPFLELQEELWNPRGTRVTLLFEPGRIKTGLKPREEAGPILEAGKQYTLVIDRDWPDAQGQPLREPFRKTFRTGSADNTSPNPKNWTLKAPAAETRNPLVVTFPEPLDRAMLERVFAVADIGDVPVLGRIDVQDHERRWCFTPDDPWSAGRYLLYVDKSLEDRVGNSIARPFEVDVFQKIERRETTETVELPFRVTK